MSFQYGQYGEGFDLERPEPQALRFEEQLHIHGEDIKVIQQTVTGHDGYGQPQFSENAYTLKAVIKTRLSESMLPPGEVKRASAQVLFTRWAPVGEENYELELEGHRYHVTGVEKTSAYLLARAERMVE
ncbi:MAG: hypothetical protein NWE89_01250 [Candidatus Bathyarchaeota archaeon]|nr:hypothetical protein [Candidatus Bathyarchaeota archaeon]